MINCCLNYNDFVVYILYWTSANTFVVGNSTLGYVKNTNFLCKKGMLDRNHQVSNLFFEDIFKFFNMVSHVLKKVNISQLLHGYVNLIAHGL